MNRHWGVRRLRAHLSFLALMATSGAAFAGEPPVVQFDVPRRLVAHEVIEATAPSAFRLMEVTVPVTVRIAGGDVGKVQEVIIEIDGSADRLVVHDFAPQTTLGSELAGDIQVTITTEKARTFDASLGGQSPIPLGDVVAQVAPSVSVGNKNRTAETKTTARLAPKRPVVVSGTLNDGHGAFYQLRPSTQTTLEGQQQLSVVFRVPVDWSAGHLDVRCWARGERQILWFDQPQVWGSSIRRVAVSVPLVEVPSLSARPHMVAKQPTKGPGENWVPSEGDTESVKEAQTEESRSGKRLAE